MPVLQKFNSFVEALAEKKHNLGADQLMVALCAAANAPDASDAVLTDLTEVSYTGLSSRVITVTSSAQSSGRYQLTLADLTITAGGTSVGPFRYIVIYNNTASNDELIGWIDRGSDTTLLAGESITFNFDDTNGLFSLGEAEEPPADLGIWFDAGTPATTEITTDIETNVISGVAPLAVFFDAKGTTGTGVTEPYGELAYAWDFDDGADENWAYGALVNGGEAFPKNRGLGPEEFHLYKAAGNYTTTLQVRDPDKKMASDSVEIEVLDPNDIFSGTNTVLVSTGSDFTRGSDGTYTGASEVTTSSISTINSLMGGGKRVLLKAGDVWEGAGNIQFNKTTAHQLGRWGDGARPIIRASLSSVSQVGGGPAVTFTGIPTGNYQLRVEITTGGTLGAAVFRWSIDNGATWVAEGVTTSASILLGSTGVTANFPAGTYVLSTTYDVDSVMPSMLMGADDSTDPADMRVIGVELQSVGFEWQGQTLNALFFDCVMRNDSAVCSGSVMNFFGQGIPDGVFFIECDFQGVPPGSGNNIVFMAAKRQAYYGCRFSDSSAGEHILRLSTAQRLVIAHCSLDGAPVGRHLLKLHAPNFDTQPTEGAGSPTPGIPNPDLPAGRYSEYANVHDNLFVNTEGCEWMVHPAPQNDIQNERGRYYIFERNFFNDPDGLSAVILFMCDVLNSWVRSNIFNRGTGTAMQVGLGQRDSSIEDLMGLHNCWLANNTHYGPSSTQSIIDFRGPFGSGVSWENINQKNGLVVRGTIPTDAELTSSDNEITTAPEFVVDPPDTADDYNLQSDSPAIGAGTGEGAAFWDLFLRPLNWGNGTTVDVGCTQYEEP